MKQNKGSFSYMSYEGDSKIEWNPTNQDEVAAAKEQFDALMAKGFKAFELTESGGAGMRVKRFRSDLNGVILIPQIAGG